MYQASSQNGYLTNPNGCQHILPGVCFLNVISVPTIHSISVPSSEDTPRTSHQCEPPTNVLGLTGIRRAVQAVRRREAIQQVVESDFKGEEATESFVVGC